MSPDDVRERVVKRSPLKRGPSVLRRSPLRRVSRRRAEEEIPADREWAAAVFARHGGRCFLRGSGVGCGGPIDAHHIAPKGMWPELRHDLTNGLALCRSHHSWAHDNPREARALGHLR